MQEQQYQVIKYKVVDNIAFLTLNRPERLNAMLYNMIHELDDALDRALADGARAVVLSGEGRTFCAGGDLIGRPNIEDVGKPLEDFWNAFTEKLIRLPVPVISAINGAAAGAGAALALGADFIVMEQSSYFQLAFLKIGLHPDAGAVWLLSRLVSRQRATEIMMLSERLPANKAYEWGIAYQVVEDGRAFDAAVELATQLAQGPTKAYGLLKKCITETYDGTLKESLHIERVNQAIAGRTDDFAEGLAAFREKRRPQFTGK